MSVFTVLLLASAAFATQAGSDPALQTPEQHRGQLAQLRLKMLFPKEVPEPAHVAETDPARRFEAFFREMGPALKNIGGLIRYLRAGLLDPAATEGSSGQWDLAWRRLEREEKILRTLVAEGEALQAGPLPALSRFRPSKTGYQVLEEKPEFDSPEGARLHRAVVLAAYARNLREYLARKSVRSRR